MKDYTEIRIALEEGHPREMINKIESALADGAAPEEILYQAMIPGMKNAGDYFRGHTGESAAGDFSGFKSTEGDISRILASARCMRKGLERLEPLLPKEQERELGTVILGTVKGDLHDVGKNLVAMMFRSEGFQVIDLGVDVSDKEFMRAIREHPDVSMVCISSLLTATMREMEKIVKTIRNAKDTRHLWIMVGGGSVTEEFAGKIGANAYTENAVDAARTARDYVLSSRSSK